MRPVLKSILQFLVSIRKSDAQTASERFAFSPEIRIFTGKSSRMIYKDLKCSNCGGNDFVEKSSRQYRCNYCGTDMFTQHQPTEIRIDIPNVNIPGDVAGKAKKIALFVGIFVTICVVGGIVGTFTLFSTVTSDPVVNGDAIKKKIDQQIATSMGGDISDGQRVVTEQGRSYPDTLSDRPHNPAVAVAFAKKTNDKLGRKFRYVFWGTYENKTGAVIKDPRMIMDFFSDDIKIGTAYGDPERDYLLPGEKTGFKMETMLDEPYENYRLSTPTSNFGFFNARPEIVFTKAELVEEKYGWAVTGIAENKGKKQASTSVIAYLYNKSGEYLGAAKGYISGNLDAGQKAKFRISIRTPDTHSGMSFADVWDEPASFLLDYNATPLN